MKGVVPVGNPELADNLGLALPNLGNLAQTVDKLVQEGLSIDEAAQKVAAWVDPSLVGPLQTLASVLTAVEKYL
jgi:hypothetical protein